MISENLLIIFLKDPQPGNVKTRLADTIGKKQAALLYQAMVEDLLQNLQPPENFEILLMFWPPEMKPNISKWLGSGIPLEAQTAGDLGNKMKRAFEEAFLKNYCRVILIGSDLPYLTTEFIQESFYRLEQSDLILGPTDDGGYYLIGLMEPQPSLFEDIPWSTPRVLHETLSNASKSGLTYYLLPRMQDIDTVDDLAILLNLCKDKNFRRAVPRTCQILKSLPK